MKLATFSHPTGALVTAVGVALLRQRNILRKITHKRNTCQMQLCATLTLNLELRYTHFELRPAQHSL